MLEISHLTKIYKNKKGKDVHALNDISLKFPETGMIFLLGKSGSGKSTLLNVCGGLDSPTSGEIIIKGKSSKEFTQSDFDSYRNTYVGFVFQEYNILNEFSVYDNIALAIELQNKKVVYDDIIKLLMDVDLFGYEKRKPNTLSGGQKQRIAIARALIKNPEIIMADEPTGALDSNTGKQVLDTLKKLSKDRLVIVVSHDREFAENYADRIIELKDGKVISDNTKFNKASEELSGNLTLIGDTLSIKDGKSLTNDEFSKIKNFLITSGNLILTKDDKNISSFKKIAKINDSNQQEVFENTDYDKIKFKKYGINDSKFIKSKLPLKHAIKMGASGLKNKPFRLVLTIILCSISFILFGLLSTMMFYDSESTFKDTLKKSDFEYIKLNKQFKSYEKNYFDNEVYEYETFYDTSFYENEFNEIKKEYGKDTFYAISANANFATVKKNNYYFNYINYFGVLDENHSIYSEIVGNYPKNSNEIVLSSYIVNSMIELNVYGDNNKTLNLSSIDNILNKTIVLNGKKYKVVGYFDSGQIDSKYDILKTEDDNYSLFDEYNSLISDSLHLFAFVNEEAIETIANNAENNFYYRPDITEYTYVTTKINKEEEFSNYANNSYINLTDDIYESIITSNDNYVLNDSQAYASISTYAEIVLNTYASKINDNKKKDIEIYELASNVLSNGYYKNNDFIEYTLQQRIDNCKKLYNLVKKDNIKLKIEFKLFSNSDNVSFGNIHELEIIGVYYGNKYNSKQLLVLSNDNFNSLWEEHKSNLEYYSLSESKYVVKDSVYQSIFIPYNKNNSDINKLWEIYDNEKLDKDDSKISLGNNFIYNFIMIDELVDVLYKVFLYGGLALCIFAVILFSNFISISINNKTKEIGILRAIGARSVDVFKIFFSESFFIVLICLIISIFSTFIICNILNNTISYGIGVSIFVFGIISFIIMILIGVLTSIVATYLPVRKAAKRKPVDSIRAL